MANENHDYNPMSIDATLARIESKQTANGDKLDRLIEQSATVELRLQDLERWKYWLMGVAAAVSAVVAFIHELFNGKR